MGKQPGNVKKLIGKLTGQLEVLDTILAANPDNVDALRERGPVVARLAEVKEGVKLKKQEAKAEKVSEVKADPQRSLASSTPAPIERETTLQDAEKSYGESQQSVQQAQADLQALLQQRATIRYSTKASTIPKRLVKQITSAKKHLEAENAKSERALSNRDSKKAAVDKAYPERDIDHDNNDQNWDEVYKTVFPSNGGKQVDKSAKDNAAQPDDDDDFGSDMALR
ncbi:MAG: hypothetical protein Q9226_008683, partial [Calogaya cf. arnoldii]